MNAAERFLERCRRYLGVAERPDGSNDDGGGPITRWNRRWGLSHEPWCNMFVDGVMDEAGVPDDGINHPATAITAQRARAAGAVITRPIPGCLICWPGTHIGAVEVVHTDGTVGTIEGNTANAVWRRTRATAGAVLIAPKAIRDAAPPPLEVDTIWAFQDPKGRVLAPGAWRFKAYARRARARYGTLGRRAVLTKRQGRWRILMPAEFRYGTRTERDADQAIREAQTGRRMRRVRRTVTHHPAGSTTAEALGQTQ